MQKMNGKKIGIGVAVFAVIALLGFAAVFYSMTAPMFEDSVAIVAADAEENLKIEQQLQTVQPVLEILPEPMPDAAVNVFTTETALQYQQRPAHTQTKHEIPSVIFATEPIDTAVRNCLVVLDEDFYLVSQNTNSKKDIKVIAIDGDWFVPIQGYGWTSLRQGYAYGSLPCVVNTLNQVLELDIATYIFMNSEGVWQVSDRMGGLTIELTQQEADALNQQLGTAYVAGETVMWSGGLAAYTKLTVDGDAMQHWKTACNAIIDKAKAEKNVRQLFYALQRNLTTNASVSSLEAIGRHALSAEEVTLHHIPSEGTRAQLDGVPVLQTDIAAERARLHQLIYQ